MEWQIIDDAAMAMAVEDGIWVWIAEWQMQCVGWLAEGRWWMPLRETGRTSIPAPSHYMPLPPPPTGAPDAD